MKSCPKCNNQVDDSRQFCTKCGTPIPTLIPCAACGASLPPDRKFCNKCGTPVGAGPTVAPAAEPARAPAPLPPAPVAAAAAPARAAEPLGTVAMGTVPPPRPAAPPPVQDVPAPAPAPETAAGPRVPVQAAAPKKSTPWLMIGGGAILLVVIVVVAVVVTRSGGDEGKSPAPRTQPASEPATASPAAAAAATAAVPAPATPPPSAAAAPAPTAPADPELAKAEWKRCQDLYMGMRFPEAKAACEKSLAADQSLVDAVGGLGWVLFEMQDIDGALRQAQAAESAAMTDSQRADAQVLKCAAQTVLHRETDALASIQRAISLGYKGKEAKARLAMLQGQPVPDEWTKHILPRHACWSKKGDAERKAYLVRRGFTNYDNFENSWLSMDEAARDKLEKAGLAKCPW